MPPRTAAGQEAHATALTIPPDMLHGPPGLRPRGSRFSEVIVERYAFFVDGLDLHHWAPDGQRVVGRVLDRLDVRGLCRSYLPTLPAAAI